MTEIATPGSLPPAPRRTGPTAGRPLVIALVAAVVGGAVAGVVVHEGDSSATKSHTTTTIVRSVQSPSRTNATSAVASTSGAKTVNQIWSEDGPGVVTIEASVTVSSSSQFGFPSSQNEIAQGSGFVIDTDGHILTNEHVIAGAKKVWVSFSNQDRVPATVVGADPSSDIALLKVSMPATALHPLPLGSADDVSVGDPVVAIGNPFGLARTVTAGIVSAKQRTIYSPNNFAIDNAIQTDAAINHGNSGGPLIDAEGKVVGINAQLPANSGVNANVGVGFAIPIDVAEQVLRQIREHGKVVHAWLGVTVQTVDRNLSSNARVPTDSGVLVTGINPNSPAEKAGLKAGTNPAVYNGQSYCLGGDIIVGVDGKRVSVFDDLRKDLQAKAPGDRVTLSVVHDDGSKITVEVTLGTQPSSAPQTIASGCQ